MGGSSSRENRRNAPVVRNQPRQQTHQQQAPNMAPAHLQLFRHQQPGIQQALPPSTSQQQGNRAAIQEGKTIKMLATVEPTSIHYEPTNQLLTFRLTSEVATTTWYELHTGIRQFVQGSKIVYAPNRAKNAPPRMSLQGPQDDTELAAQLDLEGVNGVELKYNKHYPVHRPCVLVVGYSDEAGMEHREHTSIDLDSGSRNIVVGQIVETGGACYAAESVFGGEHEVMAVGAPVEGEEADGRLEVGGTSPATGVRTEDNEDDALCVICLTLEKDTVVMPCRHLCLCEECANALMQHTPKCPVCRGPISLLLHPNKAK